MTEPKYECPDHPPEVQCHQEGTLCGKWKRVDVPDKITLKLYVGEEAIAAESRVRSQQEVNDIILADEIIRRLNALLTSNAVRADVGKVIAARVPCSDDTMAHPTIQADVVNCNVGFLGILNGLVGTIKGGEREGWGYITAEFDDDGRLVKFQRTKE